MKEILLITIALLIAAGCGEEKKDETSTTNDFDAVPTESSVVINETFAQSATIADWVELYNKSDADFDISGWTLQDENDRDPYIFPEGTKVPKKGFLVIEKDETGEKGFIYGLGSGDTVRLSDKEGVLRDIMSWEKNTMPAEGSIARIPDGTETKTTTAKPTKGVANTK